MYPSRNKIMANAMNETPHAARAREARTRHITAQAETKRERRERKREANGMHAARRRTAKPQVATVIINKASNTPNFDTDWPTESIGQYAPERWYPDPTVTPPKKRVAAPAVSKAPDIQENGWVGYLLSRVGWATIGGFAVFLANRLL